MKKRLEALRKKKEKDKTIKEENEKPKKER